MARPKLPPHLKRSHHVLTTLTPDEFEHLENRAAKSGTSYSDVLRAAYLAQHRLCDVTIKARRTTKVRTA